MNKNSATINRNVEPRRDVEQPAELENQFILRMPSEPAKGLREAVRSGAMNLKDRLFIKMENDIRYGEVRFDHWLMHAKLVDLPTIIESQKSIDNKSFYKTADICQMLICKEEDDQTTTDEESPTKTKKKDPNKVDKKFLWPHGIAPPLKNVRRRRFRKTLKKKFVEAPEIEKEVKRLLRVDNEAAHIRWEVINEDDERKQVQVKEEGDAEGGKDGDTSLETSNQQSVDVAEHDIFGEAVSDSEEETTNINIMELEEENSRLSGEDSRMSDSNLGVSSQEMMQGGRSLVTQFSHDMFSPQGSGSGVFDRARKMSSPLVKHEMEYEDIDYVKNESFESSGYGGFVKDEQGHIDSDYGSRHQLSKVNIEMRLDNVRQHLAELRVRRQQLEAEVAGIENLALQQRLQASLTALISEQQDKEQEYNGLASLLQLP